MRRSVRIIYTQKNHKMQTKLIRTIRSHNLAHLEGTYIVASIDINTITYDGSLLAYDT